MREGGRRQALNNGKEKKIRVKKVKLEAIVCVSNLPLAPLVPLV